MKFFKIHTMQNFFYNNSMFIKNPHHLFATLIIEAVTKNRDAMKSRAHSYPYVLRPMNDIVTLVDNQVYRIGNIGMSEHMI